MPQTELARAPAQRWIVFFGGVLLAAAAAQTHAQHDFRTQPADPLDPSVGVPSLQYRSALSDFRGFAEEDVRPWSETNQTVEQVGGWRAYLREAQQPAQEGSETGTHHDHAGHGMK